MNWHFHHPRGSPAPGPTLVQEYNTYVQSSGVVATYIDIAYTLYGSQDVMSASCAVAPLIKGWYVHIVCRGHGVVCAVTICW